MITPVVTEVAVLKSEMHNLTRAVTQNTRSQDALGKQIEASNIEPLKRGRTFRDQLYVALAAALIGGTLAVLGTVLGSAH
jgi:hypothetical protein